MVNKSFIQPHTVYLTPISPIHIGCGEDFEMTNYVIENGVLYHFEPSQLLLNESQRTQLLNAADRPDLLEIQRFFKNNIENIRPFAHYFADVATGVEKSWQARIGNVANRESNGNNVINNLAIERTAYESYFQRAYIPASSVKGALITAFLEEKYRVNGGNKPLNKKENERLIKEYIGNFEKGESAGRYIRFGDFMSNDTVQTKISFAVNYKKQLDKNGKPIKRITQRRETIRQGQYRAFKSELVLSSEGKMSQGTVNGIQISVENIQQSLNDFYLPIFKQELDRLSELNLVDDEWAKSVLNFIDKNNVALIRLGKNGADSKVYQGSNVAQIKIMQGRGKSSLYKDRATTYWLAAENENIAQNLLPFGWAILEFDSTNENEALKQWCESQPKSPFNKAEILAKRAEIEAEKIAQYQVEQEKLVKAKKAAEQEQARIATLSPDQKSVEDLLAKYENSEVKQFTNSALFSETQKLIKQAIEQNWSQEDKNYLLEKLDLDSGLLKVKVLGITYSSKKGKEFKKLRNQLKAESNAN